MGSYLALYAATLLAMQRYGRFELAEALGVFLILGVGFSAAAWLLTVGIRPLPYEVFKPHKELTALLLYLVPLSAVVAIGFGFVHEHATNSAADSVAICALKLVVFVALPAWIMRALSGYRASDLVTVSINFRHLLAMLAMSVLLIAFQAAAGRGWRDISEAHLSARLLTLGFPFVFLWLALEAGVVEEFFFRVLLQSRLTAVLKSETAGIVLASLLFGLMHAPGLYLRTGMTQEGLSTHPSLWVAVGYSIVITSVAGFLFGVLWARTRNFLLLVVVHAAADLLPNLLPTLRAFHLFAR